MAYFLFVDESGHDHRESPYEVLAGIAIQDAHLWPLISALQLLEAECFGGRYHDDKGELKAKRLLKKKTFRLAAQCETMSPAERRALARECLDNPTQVSFRNLSALAQAKLHYVERILQTCAEYDCRVFASIVIDPHIEPGSFLRKDYTYLFERFFLYLVECPGSHRGIIVFDEIEKAKSHLLIGQLTLHFRGTSNGRSRASRIIPEPFFVHSDLTTGIQLADIAAYVLSWGFQSDLLTKPRRTELAPYADTIAGALGHTTERLIGRRNRRFEIRSIKVIRTLAVGQGLPFRLRGMKKRQCNLRRKASVRSIACVFR